MNIERWHPVIEKLCNVKIKGTSKIPEGVYYKIGRHRKGIVSIQKDGAI